MKQNQLVFLNSEIKFTKINIKNIYVVNHFK